MVNFSNIKRRWSTNKYPMNPLRTSAFSSVKLIAMTPSRKDSTRSCGKVEPCTHHDLTTHSTIPSSSHSSLYNEVCGLESLPRRCASRPPLPLHAPLLFHRKVWQQLIRRRQWTVCLCRAMYRFPERRDSAPLAALEKKIPANFLASWSKQGDAAL